MTWQLLPYRAAADTIDGLSATLDTARFYQRRSWMSAIDEHLLVDALCVALYRDAKRNDLPLIALPLANARNAASRQEDADTGTRRQLAPLPFRLLTTPAHDHLTLGDALVHASLSDEELLEALSTLQTEFPRSAGFRAGNLPDASRIAALGKPEFSGANLHDTDASSRSAGIDGWQWRETRRSAWFDLQSEQAFPPGKLRRNLKRLRKRMADHGDISLRFVERADQRGDALERFFALEASGWKGGAGTAIAADAGLLGFYRSLNDDAMIVGELWFADALVASEIALIDDLGLNLVKIAHDENHAAYSPGSLLLEDTLDFGRTRGYRQLSLVTAPAWAERWHPDTAPVWRVTHYHDNLAGRCHRQFDQGKAVIRQLKART